MAFQAPAVFKKRVIGADFNRLHQVAMTADTQLGVIPLGRKETLVGRTMGPVAALAIALDDRFVGIGLEKLYFGVKMAGITHRVGPVFQHAVKIGPVGVMAGTAGALGKRLVTSVACLSRLGLFMACEAQFFLRGQKQFAIAGGVSFMAGETSAFVRYRLVRAFKRQISIRVAGKAQAVARSGKQGRTLGGMGIVTAIALAVGKRRMFHLATGLQR